MIERFALVALAVTLAGCGVPVESEPELLDVEISQSQDDETPAPGALAGVSVFLVRDDMLVQVTRELPSPPSVTSILESLLEGVTEQERQSNLRTAIPPGTETIRVSEDGSLLLIDLSGEFAAVGGEEEILAVAQVALTAFSIEGVEQVQFLLDGVPTDVPVASGALSVDPVEADDYLSLVAP